MNHHHNAWAEYLRFQSEIDTRVLSDRYWALDEAADAILDKIERGELVCPRQVDNLIRNRATKHRRRRVSLAVGRHFFPSTANYDIQLEALCDLDRYRRRCSAQEWRFLVAIGLGQIYSRVARAEEVPEATVKTWVRRLRCRLATWQQ